MRCLSEIESVSDILESVDAPSSICEEKFISVFGNIDGVESQCCDTLLSCRIIFELLTLFSGDFEGRLI